MRRKGEGFRFVGVQTVGERVVSVGVDTDRGRDEVRSGQRLRPLMNRTGKYNTFPGKDNPGLCGRVSGCSGGVSVLCGCNSVLCECNSGLCGSVPGPCGAVPVLCGCNWGLGECKIRVWRWMKNFKAWNVVKRKFGWILLFSIVFTLFLSELSYGQIVDYPGSTEIRDDFYPSSKVYHSYEVETELYRRSDRPDLTLERAFQEFTTNVRFAAPAITQSPVVEDGVYLLELNLLGFQFPGLHPILTKVDAEDHSITNYTLRGHLLYPGKVVRKLEERNGIVYLKTHGTGYSSPSLFIPTRGEYCDGIVAEKYKFALSLIISFLKIVKPTISPIERIDNFIQSAVDLINSQNDPTYFFETNSDKIAYFMAKANEMDIGTHCQWKPLDEHFSLHLKSLRILAEEPSPVESHENVQMPSCGDKLTKVGAANEEVLGKIILQAVKTNKQSLLEDYIHWESPNCYGMNRLVDWYRNCLKRKGIFDWSQVVFRRVHTSSVNGFQIDFLYKNEFIGTISNLIIREVGGKYFLLNNGNGGFWCSVQDTKKTKRQY